MGRFTRSLFLLVAGLTGWWLLIPGLMPGAGPPPSSLSHGQVARLVVDLTAKDWRTRDEAARRLGGLWYVPHALRESAASIDKERRSEAKKVVAAIERRMAPLALARAAEWAKAGEVDLAREAVVVWGPRAGEDEGWQIMTSLAQEVLTRLEKRDKRIRVPNPGRAHLKGPKVFLAAGDFDRYRQRARPKRVEGGDVTLDNTAHQLVRARGRVKFTPGARGLVSSLVICGGEFAIPKRGEQLHQRRKLAVTVVFAGGDVHVDEMSEGVVICSGDVQVTGHVGGSLMIARGAMKTDQDSLVSNVNGLFSGGKIDRVVLASPFGALAQENVSRPLGFVRFFETARVGVEVAMAKSPPGVRIVKLDAAKGFARAGLWKGDVVTAVDGVEAHAPEQFRRALLRRVVEGGEARLRVWREGEWMTVYVTPQL